MFLLDLPDDILLFILSNYLNLNDLIQISKTCTRFQKLIQTYNIWKSVIFKHPVLDFNFPNGFGKNRTYSQNSYEKYSEFYRLTKYLNLRNKIYNQKIVYIFNEKMFPTIQIGDETTDSLGFTSVYLSDDNHLMWFDLNYLYDKLPINYSAKMKSSQINKIKNGTKLMGKFKIFESNDIRKFKKKDNSLICISEKKIKSFIFDNSRFELLNEITESRGKISNADFSLNWSKIIYGCTNGYLKILNENCESSEINVNDRIIRCTLSPCENYIAIGTSGINSHNNGSPCALRIYDLHNLNEIQVFKNPGRIKIGAGILALSYIDNNIIMSAGYDTFIRIFDIRSNKCVKSLEEPEDMSIYSVCCSGYYGLISGNDRQSIVRYWDRRVDKIISSFRVSDTNSSIYSLSCTPESILACWDHGVTLIDFK